MDKSPTEPAGIWVALLLVWGFLCGFLVATLINTSFLIKVLGT